MGAHAPPVGGCVWVNLLLPAGGLPLRKPQPPAGNDCAGMEHAFKNVSE